MLTYFEDYHAGDEHITPTRTITAADIAAFATLTGDHHPLHLDSTFAQTTLFGERIAHGLFGLALVNGLAYRTIIDETFVIAFLGLNWTFSGPLRIGDSVQARVTIAECRASRHPTRGIVREHILLTNQNGETIQQGDFTFLVQRQPIA